MTAFGELLTGQSHFTLDENWFQKCIKNLKKLHANIKKCLKTFIPRHTDCFHLYKNMKIFQYENILIHIIFSWLSPSGDFLLFLKTFVLMSMECFQTPMINVGLSRCHACMNGNSPWRSSGLLECATAGNAPADREETGTAFLKPY